MLTEAQQHEVAREVVEQAQAVRDAATSPCPAPAIPAAVTGTLRVTTFGGKTTHTAIAALDGGTFAILGGATLRAGRTKLRARRDGQDFTRPLVIELAHSGRVLDASSGTLVIEATAPELVGHLEAAELRERDELFAYVTPGCASRIARIDFRFRRE